MKYYCENIRQVIRFLRTSINDGLDNETIGLRLKTEGKNILQAEKPVPVILKFLNQFKDFMVIVLILAAVISALAEIYSGGREFVDSIVIGVIVIFNGIIGTVQECRADNALEALKEMTVPKTRVIREGKELEINAEDLVRGDIIILEAGDIVPADCRIIEGVALKTDESLLTGEVVGIDKEDCMLNEETPLAERKNMLYMGTSVVQGRVRAVVTDTGKNTEMGKISAMLQKADEETPLQKKLNKLGKELGTAAILICITIFCIGVFRGFSTFKMFMTAVSLAVAAIPEGLTAVVTIVLAIGVQKMAKKNAIVKRLSAVEALGNATVICSDKTGTITENKMTLCYASNDETVKLACLCCDADEEKGEATELGIVRGARDRGMKKYDLENNMPRVYEIPFSSERRRMTTVHKLNNDYLAISKGAVEEILNICRHVNKNSVIKEADSLAVRGLRVMAVAKRVSSTIIKEERDFSYVGLVALADRPRKGVRDSVEACRQAGVRTIMITGDNGITAKAIAGEIGIISDVITGGEIEKMDNDKLSESVKSCSIYARVTPEHKYRIVDSLRKQGETVAFAGDGINDAPSIKLADIGCAMGGNGTEVARQASDIVLADDNFNTIVAAIKEGRGIYENILKVIHFLLSSNIGEILVIFLAVIMGFSVPLLPVQLLWVNLVTDSLPAVALGVDTVDSNIMNGRRSEKGMWNRIVLEGFMIGTLALLAFAIGKVCCGDLIVGRTMCFCTLSISQLVHAFNMRSRESLININLLDNLYLVGALILGILLQWLVVEPELMNGVFGTVGLEFYQWLTVMGLCIVPVAVCELEKRL
ncbi:MAG: cation-translocating P-type ATPase [Clostridia bacterium]|nr:cation-translocating P-type ATPase [Clostridia bacterium]